MTDETKKTAESTENVNAAVENAGGSAAVQPEKGRSKLARIIGIIVLILVILVIACVVFIGSIIKGAVQEVGSSVTKCPITVKNVGVSLLRGKLTVNDLVVGNPEGFKTESAFKLTKVYVDLEMSSLFKDKIIIDEIQIVGPEITYEVATLKLTSNIGAIQKNVKESLPAGDDKDKEEKKEAPKKPGKKIQINHVIVSDGQINVSATALGGHALSVPLPTIEMKDIGKDKEVTSTEAAAKILQRTLTGVVDAATDAIKNAGKALKDAGKGIKDAGKGIKDAGKGIKDAGKSIKDAGKGIKDAGKGLLKSITGNKD